MLAARLGLSKAAIYHHFASKEEILAAALDRALGQLESVLDETRSSGNVPPDPLARLEAVIRGAVRVLIEELPCVTLLLRVRGNTTVERDALERRRAFDKAVTAIVTDARDAGVLRADVDPSVATRLVFGTVNSLTEWYRPGGRESAERMADVLLAVALDGLRPRI
jgi:AcrR family transcriptional regulator